MKRINIIFCLFVFSLVSCKEKQKITFQCNDIDSIVVLKRDEGQLYSDAKRFVIINRAIYDTIYQSYFKSGKYLEDYYVKIPAGRYLLKTYHSNFKNDTVKIWENFVHVSSIGVINLQRNIEPLLDNLFKEDSLRRWGKVSD